MSTEHIDRVLARVDADLARGHTFPAAQRLATLVRDHSTNEHLRERLAAVHLQTGNFVQAGRWSYLAGQRDEVAVAAFERAFRHPVARWQALRWRGPVEAASPTAQDRFRALRAEALAWRGVSEDSTGELQMTDEIHDSNWQDGVAVVLVLLMVVAVLALLAIGVSTVVDWIF